MATSEIRLLGTFLVRVDDRAVPDQAWQHRRAAQLVKILALADGHRLHRERLMDLLWPELDGEAAAANLRKAVHFARRALGTEDSIRTANDMVELLPGREITVDALRFEQSTRDARDQRAIAAAADLYAGELLPEDRYAPWADEPRDRLRLRLIQMLKRGGLWERVLEVDPADEEAHRALMQQALDAGDRSGALRQFELLRERLRTDLGMGPDEASVRLYEKALELEGHEPPTAAERARALLAWGIVHLNSGDLEEAERAAEGARKLAIDARLGREIGEASGLLGSIAHMRGRWKQLFHSEFVASVRRSPELAAPVFDAHLCLAEFCLCGPGGHEEMVDYARELLAVATQAGSVQGRALAELLLGEADLFSDRLTSAEEHLAAAASLHEQALAPGGQVVTMQRLAELQIARGQRWRAGRLIRRALRLAEGGSLASHLVVRLHGTLVEATPDESKAAALVSRADAALGNHDVCLPCSMGFRMAASIALARAGFVDEARRRLDESERIAGMWPSGPWHAGLWEARGVIRLAEGDPPQAAALFKEAAARFASMGRPRDAARCRAAAAS